MLEEECKGGDKGEDEKGRGGRLSHDLWPLPAAWEECRPVQPEPAVSLVSVTTLALGGVGSKQDSRPEARGCLRRDLAAWEPALPAAA